MTSNRHLLRNLLARGLLDWEPEIELREGLSLTLEKSGRDRLLGHAAP